MMAVLRRLALVVWPIAREDEEQEGRTCQKLGCPGTQRISASRGTCSGGENYALICVVMLLHLMGTPPAAGDPPPPPHWKPQVAPWLQGCTKTRISDPSVPTSKDYSCHCSCS